MTLDELEALEASWPVCDYWSMDPYPERLTHRTVVDALELDELRDADHAIDWFLRFKPTGALPLYGFTRKAVTADAIDSMVERLSETFHEHWTEALELGDPELAPDDQPEPAWLRAAVTADMRDRLVWACEQTHEITLSTDTVARLVVRERRDLAEQTIDAAIARRGALARGEP